MTLINRVRIAGLLAALASASVPPLPAQAQIPDAASKAALGAIGNMLVGDVVDQINQLMANCASIANNSVNLDYGNAYISLQAGVQGVFNSVDNERKTVVNNLDDERKYALLDVYVLANDMVKNQIPFVQAKLKVDTLTVLNHVALLGKKTPFMISLIDPTVVAEKPNGDYQITVVGIGIGNPEGTQLPTTVTLSPPDGMPQEIKPDNSNEGITFTIPRAMLEPHFNDTVFYRLPIKIESKVNQPCGFLHLATCDQPYSFDWRMTLFPRHAITGTVAQIKATPSTDPNSRTPKYVQADTANGDGNGGHGIIHSWATPVVVPDAGYLFTKIDYTSCVNGWVKPGNPCAFMSISDGTLVPRNGGSSAQVSGTNWSWPLSLHFTLWEEKQITVSQALPSYPISFSAGQSIPVVVFGDVASAIINLTTVTGQQAIIPLIPPGGKATDPLVCTNATNIGNDQTQFICTAKDTNYY